MKKQMAKYSRRDLKPLFEEGDEVYTAWWPDDVKGARDVENNGGWFPGTVKNTTSRWKLIVPMDLRAITI